MSTQRKPEWCRQAWLGHFLERAVLPPCEIRSFDKAGAHMASMATRMMAQGRFVKDGTADLWVFQGAPLVVVPIEVKHNGTETPAQAGTARSLERCGINTIRNCRTTQNALMGLRLFGVRLHENAFNLAVEYQERMNAGLRELAARPKKPRTAAPRPRRKVLTATGRKAAARIAGLLT